MLRPVCSVTRKKYALKKIKRTTVTKKFNVDSRSSQNTLEASQLEPDSAQDITAREKAAEFYEQGKVTEAVSLLEQLLAKDNTNVNTLKCHSAMICALPGRYEEALKSISKAIAFCPRVKGAELWATKAFVLFVGKDYDQAVACAKAALQRKPKLAEGHYALALAFSGLRQYYPSLPHFDTALELSPQEVEIDYWRGQSLYYLDRTQEAFQWLSKPTLEKNPLRGSYYKGLRAFRDQKYAEALVHFQGAKAGRNWNPLDTTDLVSWKGECHLHLGEPEKALQCFDLVLQKNGKDGLANHGKGEALTALKKADEAKQFFKAALASDPSYYKSDYHRVKQLPKL